MKKAPTKYLKRLGIQLVIVGFSIMLSSHQLSFAANSDADPNVNGGISVAKCISKGNIDFGLFLNTLIYNDGFYDGVIEPWNDVLTRNKCQGGDISNLLKQQDKIRKNIRDAFLTCKNEKLPGLERAFDELNMEVYYVRNIVDGTFVATLPFDVLSSRSLELEDGESDSGGYSSMYTSTSKMHKDMVEKYVGDISLSEAEFELFFNKLVFKYEERKKEYVFCTNGSWQQVAEKWEEFINTAGGIAPAWKEAEKEVGGASEKLVESLTDGGLEAWYSGILQMNLNSLPPKEGFSDIMEHLDKNLPGATPGTGAGGASITQKSLLDAIEVSDSKFDTDKMKLEMTTKFQSIYRDTSDDGTALLVSGLVEYDKILNDSLPLLDKLVDGANMMNERQCPGKF